MHPAPNDRPHTKDDGHDFLDPEPPPRGRPPLCNRLAAAPQQVGMNPGRLWAVAGCGREEADVLVGALERHGQQTTCLTDPTAGLRSCDELTAIVFRADADDPLATEATMRQVRLSHPRCRLVVLVDEPDAASASVVMRNGGHPLHSTDGIARWIEPAPFDDRSALEALDAAVHGRLVPAMANLSRADAGTAAALATEELTVVASLLLDRLAYRSRYSIPVRLITERFAPGAHVDPAACLDMLQWAAARNNVVDFGVDELVHRHGSHGVLFGAFNSAYGLVRFASDRWWRPATSVLHDVSRTVQGIRTAAPVAGAMDRWALRLPR